MYKIAYKYDTNITCFYFTYTWNKLYIIVINSHCIKEKPSKLKMII